MERDEWDGWMDGLKEENESKKKEKEDGDYQALVKTKQSRH